MGTAVFVFALLTAATIVTSQEPPREGSTCQLLQLGLPWLECDGNHFSPIQCMEEDECFCVNPLTGLRIDVQRNRPREDVNCDDAELPDDNDYYYYEYDYEFDEAEHCLDYDQMRLVCNGINCIREPFSNETCLQCKVNCNETSDGLFDDECRTAADCPNNSMCTAVGFFRRKECVEFIRDGEMCLPVGDYGDFEFDFDNEFDFEDDDYDVDYDDRDYGYDYFYDYDYFNDFDNFDEEEEDIYDTVRYLVDSSMQFDGKKCAPHQFCKKFNRTMHTCQNKTGSCNQRDGQPIQPPGLPNGKRLKCNIDGTFQASQYTSRNQWCVFPNNGSEIPNTRTSIIDELPVYCEGLGNGAVVIKCSTTIVYSSCPVTLEFNGYDYTIDHGDEGLNVEGVDSLNCSHCYCNDGQFEDCYPVVCPFGSDPTALRSCNINGTTYHHYEFYDDNCNMCVCINGNVYCTSLICEGEDDDDESRRIAACHNSMYDPVCGINFHTYPNLCAAQAAGLNQLEVLPGACTRESICALHPCEQGFHCFPLATACSSETSCSADDFRKCVNATMLRCPVTNRTSSQVCGLNGRTYQSVCQLMQLSRTQVRFPGPCNRTDCRNSSNSKVCGTDGITYRTMCDLKTRPNVRVDYRGRCLSSKQNETVNTYCARVQTSGLCNNRTNCTVLALPYDGCCPICGGGLSIAYDKGGLDMYDDVIGEARTTKGIRSIMRRSALVRDQSKKCLVEVEFTSNGDLELLYIAKNDSDALACATIAVNVTRTINSLREGPTGKKRQAEETNAVDPIFNYMRIAAPLEQEILNGTVGDGTDGVGTGGDETDDGRLSHGIAIFSSPCNLVFTLVVLFLRL